MDSKQLDDFFKKDSSFSINPGLLVEWMMIQTISTTLLTSTVLRKQLELEELIKEGNVDYEKVESQMTEITNAIADQATAQKNSLIADFYLKTKG